MDAYRLGWVAVAIDAAGFVDARCAAEFRALLGAFEEAQVFGVDIPIGLVDAPVREADAEARRILKGNASSVFNAPVASALAATSYAEANAISLRHAKKGLSRQSYALFAKVREVDAVAGDRRIFEVHPEVSFRVMNEGRPLVGRKKTWGGMQARLALLAAQGIALPPDVGEANAAGVDDLVDAAAAAWSARRIATGMARCLPIEPRQHTGAGRAIAIWA